MRCRARDDVRWWHHRTSSQGMPRSRRPSTRRGAAAIEFVLTLPVLALLLFGAIEFGNYFSQLGTVTDVVQDAARYGAKQDRAQLALSLSGAVAEQLFEDLGVQCSGCVTTRMLTQAGRNYLEVSATVPYNSVTGIVPNSIEGLGFAPPVSMRVQAIYPQR